MMIEFVEKDPRMTREEYFLKIAELSAERSTCSRAKVGCVAVKENRIIMSAYNGSPANTKHCVDTQCFMHEGHCVRTLHAEQNIITQCAKTGTNLYGADLYCTHEPCPQCKKLLISAGVKRVIIKNLYIPDYVIGDFESKIDILLYLEGEHMNKLQKIKR